MTKTRTDKILCNKLFCGRRASLVDVLSNDCHLKLFLKYTSDFGRRYILTVITESYKTVQTKALRMVSQLGHAAVRVACT